MVDGHMSNVRVPPIDKRILEPGWAGETESTEVEFLTAKLKKDRRLATKWGFAVPVTTQTDWAILQVAMWGDPDWKALNSALTRKRCSVPYGLQLSLF